MTQSGPGTRRMLLKAALAAVGACALWLMNSMARRNEALPENAAKILTVPLPAGDGIQFAGPAIVISKNRELAVFSSACSHLGCRIHSAEGDELVCPCHGSRYNLRGQVVHGPATRGLQPLAYELDRAASALRIALKS